MAVPTSVDAREPDAAYGPAGRSAWLDVDWREHLRSLHVGGRAVNVVELGSGPPLLFVHGLSGCWQNWLENLPVFARDHRIVAIDLPGFGASEMPADVISVGGYVRLLDEVCAALSIDAATVIGNSMGGLVAAELALTAPARVSRLVLVSAAGLQIAELPFAGALRHVVHARRVVDFYGGLMAAQATPLSRRARLRRILFSSVAAHPDRLPWPIVAEQVAGLGRPGFLPALAAITSHPLRARLHAIACPTLIVWGARDRLVPVRDADAFEQLIPGARKIVYPDTGHVPMLERPGRFNADLRRFLEEGAGADGPARG